MKRVETKIIEIEDHFYQFRFSILSMMTFQTMYGKELSECKTLTEYINYFYCAYISGCNYENLDVKLTAVEFIKLVDTYPEVLTELTKAFEDSLVKKN